MRFVSFLILVLLAAPFGVIGFEVLEVFARPDRFAPLIGLPVEFDMWARVGFASVAGAFVAMLGWALVARPRIKQSVAPAIVAPQSDSRAIKAERDYWRAVVVDLLKAQNVSDDEQERLLATIRTNLTEPTNSVAQGDGKKTLVAER